MFEEPIIVIKGDSVLIYSAFFTGYTRKWTETLCLHEMQDLYLQLIPLMGMAVNLLAWEVLVKDLLDLLGPTQKKNKTKQKTYH